jgi:hypothetical protein
MNAKIENCQLTTFLHPSTLPRHQLLLTNATHDHDNPIIPAPAHVLEDKATYDRSNDRSVHRSNRPYRESESTVLLRDDVVDRTRCIRNQSTSAEGSKESRDHL